MFIRLIHIFQSHKFINSDSIKSWFILDFRISGHCSVFCSPWGPFWPRHGRPCPVERSPESVWLHNRSPMSVTFNALVIQCDSQEKRKEGKATRKEVLEVLSELWTVFLTFIIGCFRSSCRTEDASVLQLQPARRLMTLTNEGRPHSFVRTNHRLLFVTRPLIDPRTRLCDTQTIWL